MTGTCASCGVRFTLTDRPLSVGLGGPFPTVYHLGHHTCASCGVEHTMVTSDADLRKTVTWNTADEALREGRDYIWAGPSTRAPDGQLPLVIAWAWLPAADDEELGEALAKAIKSDEILRRTDRYSLLILEHDRPATGVVKLINRFTGCILLKNHVLAGGTGPYPSYRAEVSIFRTWKPCNLTAVKHYWPSVSLSATNYVPLMPDAKLMEAWASYARRNLPVSRKGN